MAFRLPVPYFGPVPSSICFPDSNGRVLCVMKHVNLPANERLCSDLTEPISCGSPEYAHLPESRDVLICTVLLPSRSYQKLKRYQLYGSCQG